MATTSFRINDAEVARFHEDGYLVVDSLLNADETSLLQEAARGDSGMRGHAFGVDDRDGNPVKLSLWNHPGDDIYGVVSRSERIVDAMEKLLDDEVYHYHSKMILKEPRVGGAWEWHQDYGYWYQNGCLYPDMLSVMIAVDGADRENGCLEVLRGSHLLGRVEHGRYGEQTGADPVRVAAARERLELVRFEADPGDTLFFHSNLLHASGPNTSARPRWTLLLAYNSRHHDPSEDSHHPRYTPLDKVDDDAIKAWARRPDRARSRRSYLKPEDDQTLSTGKS